MKLSFSTTNWSIRIWIKIEQSQVFIAFKVICFIFEKLFISCKNFQFMAKTFKGYYKTARIRVSFFYINWIKLNTCSHKNLHNGKCLIVSRLKMCTIRMLKHRQQNYPKANTRWVCYKIFHNNFFLEKLKEVPKGVVCISTFTSVFV